MRRYFGDHMTAMASRQLPAHQPRRELVSHSYVDSMELFQLAETFNRMRSLTNLNLEFSYLDTQNFHKLHNSIKVKEKSIRREMVDKDGFNELDEEKFFK